MAAAPLTLVWFRRDLRVHDHPALHGAGERAVGVFVLDPRLLEGAGRYVSQPRAAFGLACVAELREALRARGGELLVRRGDPVTVLPALAGELGATAVRWTSDVSPLARRRDRAVTEALRAAGVTPAPQSGTYAADPSRTAPGATVFSPFHRAWEQQERRAVLPAPERFALPGSLEPGELPALADPTPEPIAAPGERAARAALEHVVARVAPAYATRRGMVAGGSSELSPHLRWGTLSARELEERLIALPGRGPRVLRKELAWRDFNAHLLLARPESLRLGMTGRQPRYDEAPERLAAWQEGRTGFPLVDAGMRQLAAQGWMHNRARMLTASFLVHDLHVHWRAGEEHFARLLYDGEPAQNALNWQWVAGVGADPGDFLRVFNPVTQAREFDPDGGYVARWVPELAALPAELRFEPWAVPGLAAEGYGCVVGRDYPAPIVDHAAERREAIARFEAAGRVPAGERP